MSTRREGFGIQQVELELGADRRPVPQRFRARHLRLQRAARIDRDRLVVGADRAPEAEGAAFFPWHRVRRTVREDVHVRVAVVHVDVGGIPDVAGHVAGEHRDGERVAGFAHSRPPLGRDALAPQEAVQVAEPQGDGVGAFGECRRVVRHRRGLRVFLHDVRLLHPILYTVFRIWKDASPQFLPRREARARRCLDWQGERASGRAGVLDSTSSTRTAFNAANAGRSAPAAVRWWELRAKPALVARMGDRPEVVVVGAGIAGVMTRIEHAAQGLPRASSWTCGSRDTAAPAPRTTRGLLRAIYGSDELYTRWARESRLRWLELQEQLGCLLYDECGALILAGEGRSAWEDSALSTFGRLGVPHQRLDVDEVRLRFPQFRCPRRRVRHPRAGGPGCCCRGGRWWRSRSSSLARVGRSGEGG